MTKNHILIRNAVLGWVFSFSSWANAQVDQVLVVFFDQFYATQALKCTLDPGQKTIIARDLEAKCLIRMNISNNDGTSGFFIYKDKFKDGCSQTSVKVAMDAKIEAICGSTSRTGSLGNSSQSQLAASSNPKGTANIYNNKIDYAGGAQVLAQGLANLPTNRGPSGSNSNSNLQPSGTSNTNSGNSQFGNKTGGGASKPEGTSVTQDKGPGVVAPAAVPAIATDYKPPVATFKMQGTDAASQARVESTLGADGYTLTVKNNQGLVTSKIENVQPGDLKGKLQELKADPATGSIPVDPGAAEAATKVPTSVQGTAGRAVDGKTAVGADDVLTARNKAAETEDANLKTQITAIEAEFKTLEPLLPAEAEAKCNAPDPTGTMIAQCTAVPKALTCLKTNLAALQAEHAKLTPEKTACSTNSADADKGCSMIRSEKAQQVQQVMSLGLAVLSKVYSASESCGTISTISKVAQGGMLIAQGACSLSKFACDMSCASASKSIKLMQTKAQAIVACGLSALAPTMEGGAKAEMAANKLAGLLGEQLAEGKPVPASIVQCKKHAADIAQMGMAALGFLSAAQDGKKCEEQLKAGSSGGSGSSTSGMAGPNMTTAEFCGMPQNASSITCKCTADPNAEGCLGSLAKSGVSLGKVNAGAGASGFASAKTNGLGSLGSDGKIKDSSEPEPGAGLSPAAREALGLSSSASNPGGMSNGGSGRSTAGVEGANGKGKAETKEAPKFSFLSSIGNALGLGRKPDQAAKAAIRNYEQEEAIKRKVASEKIRSEITTASGKSNFDKIKNAYQSNGSSFEQ